MTKKFDAMPSASSSTEQISERDARIEAKKDSLSLKRELEFIESFKDVYRARMKEFFCRAQLEESVAFSEGIIFIGFDQEKAQISIDHIRQILSRVPAALVARSNLAEVDFRLQDSVPVPAFDEEGNFDGSGVQMMKIDDFLKSDHNPYRILIGLTQHYVEDSADGSKIMRSRIKETGIPPTISNDQEAVLYYQTHVFMHEFFHTVEGAHFNDERAQLWVLDPNTGRTFIDWKSDYAQACLEEPAPGSYYAGSYTDELFNTHDGTPNISDVPMREWMSEDFVGVLLGIVPNKDGATAVSIPHKRAELIRELLA